MVFMSGRLIPCWCAGAGERILSCPYGLVDLRFVAECGKAGPNWPEMTLAGNEAVRLCE